MRFVVVETPYSGNTTVNIAYAKECVMDCLKRGEAPFASHLFFTQPALLDDENDYQRKLGMEAGLAIAEHASATVVYIDLGISPGMTIGIERAYRDERPVEYRQLYKEENG